MVTPTLAEELFLLALGDGGRPFGSGRGTRRVGSPVELVLAGAQLCELVLRGRVALDGSRLVAAGAPLGDAQLDDVLATLTPGRPTVWVRRTSPGLAAAYTARLVAGGVLRRERSTLGLETLAYEAPAVLAGVRERVAATLRDPAAPDARGGARVALLVHALGHPVGLDHAGIADAELRDRGRRIAGAAVGAVTLLASRRLKPTPADAMRADDAVQRAVKAIVVAARQRQPD
jgi:Golgi phosphoprotein 3 (GPP34)